mgnify:CR=1 FL=1
MAATLISRSTWTDDSGGGTDGTVINNAELALIYDKIDGLFKRTTAGDLTLELENTDVTGTSDTGVVVRTGSGAAGDAYFQATNGTTTWTWGLDNSDSDNWVLAASASLGTTNVFTVTTAGLLTFIVAPSFGTVGFKSTSGNCFIGDDANANMTLGLTINQGVADNEILALKSSDVAHGVTDVAETDTFFTITKTIATTGGARLRGFSSDEAALALEGIGVVDNTTKTTGAGAYCRLIAVKKSGTTTAPPGANANMVVFQDGGGSARFIFDVEGSGFADVEWITYDAHDDIAELDRLQCVLRQRRPRLTPTRHGPNALLSHRRHLERLGIIGRNSWHIERARPRSMINFTRLAMLHHGALLQLADRLTRLEAA